MLKLYLLYLMAVLPEIFTHPEYHYTYRYRPVSLYQNIAALPTLSPFLSKLQSNPPLVECFQPRGLRMSLSDMPELESVQYEFLNAPGLSGLQPPIQRPFNGRWVFTSQMVKMNMNDQFSYRVHCKTNGENHVLENSHTITNLIPAPKDLDFPSQAPPQYPTDSCPPTESQPRIPAGFCPCPDYENAEPINPNNTVESRIDVNNFDFNPINREETTDPNPLKQRLNPDDDIDLDALSKDLTDAKKELFNVRQQLEELLKLAETALNKDPKESMETISPKSETDDLEPPISNKNIDDIIASLAPTEKKITKIDELLPQEAKNPEDNVNPNEMLPTSPTNINKPSTENPSANSERDPPTTTPAIVSSSPEKSPESPEASPKSTTSSESPKAPSTTQSTLNPTSSTPTNTQSTSNPASPTPPTTQSTSNPASSTSPTTTQPTSTPSPSTSSTTQSTSTTASSTSPTTQSTSNPASSTSPTTTQPTSSPSPSTSSTTQSTSTSSPSTSPTTQSTSTPASPTTQSTSTTIPSTTPTTTTTSSTTEQKPESSTDNPSTSSTSTTTQLPEKSSSTSTIAPTTEKSTPTTAKSPTKDPNSTPKTPDMDSEQSETKPVSTDKLPTEANTTPSVPDVTTAKPELDDMAKELQKLQELLKETQKQLKRRNLELVLVNNKPTNNSDALKDVRDFIRDELKLKDFDKKITRAEYTKCGILFETENPDDKILILEKVNEHLPLDSKFQVNEPDFEDPNCNFSKEMKMDESLVVQNVKISG